MRRFRENVVPIDIEDELKTSYLNYSMSVIVQRALPDARDGLKPSQRRVLLAMNDLGLTPGRAFRKCAKIAGDTSGNYHPHGEQVIYPTLVRMAQDFVMRYPLVNGQGNFGSVDGDAPAAMRYTEARMSQNAVELLTDIDKDTVDFIPNYDDTRTEPVVFPGRFPNLLCNGSSGIAVGMATNIPPHNLGEVARAAVALLDQPDLPDEDLLELVPGPDFPGGGIIFGKDGIRDMYLSGRGKMVVRARANIESKEDGGKESIVVVEIPYQVNKSGLLESIAELVKRKKIEGIADLRDESDRDGMRIVIELKRDAIAEIVLNQLFKHTQMQSTFGAILLCLVNGRPRTLTLRQLLEHHLSYRTAVIERRTRYLLNRAEEKAHLLEGLRIALEHLDEVIALIKAARDTAKARDDLMARFALSERQAQAILDMRLARLTALERHKLEEEYLAVIKEIERLRMILSSREQLQRVVRQELEQLAESLGDDRRTDIVGVTGDFRLEDLIAEEDMVVTISHAGYIKRIPAHTYRRQHRGGKGITGAGTRQEDFLEHMFIASTHSYILLFTSKGRCYWLKVHEAPQGGRLAKGKALVNLVQLEKDEKIMAIVPVKEFDEGAFVVMATAGGLVNKTRLTAFSHPRRTGIKALAIRHGDELIEASLTDGTQDVVLATREGQAIRFPETEVRPTGRDTMGVKGISLSRKADRVVGMVNVKREACLLGVTDKGFGKRTPIGDYRVTHRGGKGIVNLKTTERVGKVVAIKEVVATDELMLMTREGMIIRVPISGVRVTGRAAQGVTLINLAHGDEVVDVARVIPEEEESENDREDLAAQESDNGDDTDGEAET
jgi:DNA gyrase subunit A